MRIFLAGATGVVGRRVVPLLVAAGHRVTAVGRNTDRLAQFTRMGASAAPVDLFDPAALAGAVARHDVVVNLATHIPKGWRMAFRGAWGENDRIRSIASGLLVDAAIAAGAQRLIQESFGLTYPDRGDQWIDETTPIAPTPYNRSVADAERAAERFTASGPGLTGVVLRFAGFYGADSEQTVQLIRMVRKGMAPLPGPAEAFFSSVSHDDAATAVLAALGVPPGAYNVVDNEPLTRRDFFDSLARTLGVKPPRLPPGWMTRLMGSLGETLARSERISNRKLRGASGWAPRYPSVREGWKAVLDGGIP